MATTEKSTEVLIIRLIMQGKDVGSIIGKKGEIVKRFRDESGAKINISDGSCPERIVTVAGQADVIYKAFVLICNKFEEDLSNLMTTPGDVTKPPITFRLIVPASQCGSLIGKGGSKIKEIREMSCASIQVASEMLPNSTERAVTISGTSDAIIQCIYQICLVMIECPAKGITVPYRPLKPVAVGSHVLQSSAGGQSVTAGQVVSTGANAATFTLPIHSAASAVGLLPTANAQAGKYGCGSVTGLTSGILANINGMATPYGTVLAGLSHPAVLAAALSTNGQISPRQHNLQQSQEMTLPNELIGCIIGKGGAKIAEIRQISGAMIRISNCDERELISNGGTTNGLDRTITITGTAESVALAQYLINMSTEIHKAQLEAQTYNNNPLIPNFVYPPTPGHQLPRSLTNVYHSYGTPGLSSIGVVNPLDAAAAAVYAIASSGLSKSSLPMLPIQPPSFNMTYTPLNDNTNQVVQDPSPSSSLAFQYHVTPKLKIPARFSFTTPTSSRTMEKFSPY